MIKRKIYAKPTVIKDVIFLEDTIVTSSRITDPVDINSGAPTGNPLIQMEDMEIPSYDEKSSNSGTWF